MHFIRSSHFTIAGVTRCPQLHQAKSGEWHKSYMILKSRVTVRFSPLMIEHLQTLESLMQSASKLSIQKMRSGMTLASRFARAISCFWALAFLAAVDLFVTMHLPQDLAEICDQNMLKEDTAVRRRDATQSLPRALHLCLTAC